MTFLGSAMRTCAFLSAVVTFTACDALNTEPPVGVDPYALEGSDSPTIDTFEEMGMSVSAASEVVATYPCFRDAAEPDDRPELASSLSFDVSSEKHSACGDADNFAIRLSPEQPAQIRARFDRSEGDIEILVISPRDEVVAVSEIRGDAAHVEWTAEQAGEYTLRVELVEDRGQVDGTTYSVRPLDPLAVCVADASEPNDQPSDATSIPGVLEQMTACDSDEDWYVFDATLDAEITVSLYTWDDAGQVDFALYDPSGEFKGGSFQQVGPEQSFTATADDSGRWRVLVYLADGSQQGVPYDIQIKVDG
jgi:hypothetical protein